MSAPAQAQARRRARDQGRPIAARSRKENPGAAALKARALAPNLRWSPA